MASNASKWQFSPAEIRAKLAELGYHNIPDEALKEFSNDLHQLIATENTTTDQESTSASILNTSTTSTTCSESSDCSDVKTHREPGTDHHHPFLPHHTYHQYIAPEKENQTDITNTSLRLAQKRKVLRHKDGKARVFDESFTNETSVTDISDMEERLQSLPLKDKDDNISNHSNQSGGSSSWQHLERNMNVLPSFIRPRTADPNSRGTTRRTDPVNRYHQFKEEWRAKKVPGEKMHKNLRWSTRAQMLQHETFEKPQHRYIPNNYVAPTEKKRQALRWEVRSALANS